MDEAGTQIGSQVNQIVARISLKSDTAFYLCPECSDAFHPSLSAILHGRADTFPASLPSTVHDSSEAGRLALLMVEELVELSSMVMNMKRYLALRP